MTNLCKIGIVFMSAAMLFTASAQQTDTSGSDSLKPPHQKMMDSTAMCGMMMMYFMKPSVAFETTDGFIVITGNKIVKYDSNLNVIKETEIPVDTTAMRNMMQKMHQCPMMNGGDGSSAPDTSTGNKPAE